MSKITLEKLILQAAEAVRPAARMTVSESAERFRYINMPGSYVGNWLNSTTPYLVEVMDVLTSPDYTGGVLVGPAQCGKTDVVLNWLLHSIINDPADLMIVQTSRTTARDFSIRRVERLHRHHAELLAGKVGKNNTFDVHYLSGMLLTLSWPTINELSGKPIPRLWLTDYDRMPQNVDDEGSPFDLARKRATSFKSHGMCFAESSPGFAVENPKWIRKTRHEAEPTPGILGLYNRGDRRRWYWRCVSCKGTFEPDFELLDYPNSADLMESAEQAVLKCPHCAFIYHHEGTETRPGKRELNNAGRWVKDGQVWGANGQMSGTAIRSNIASFWLKGVAAAFSDWKGLVFSYLSAQAEYESTGSEEALKTTINVDQGKPYVPMLLSSDRVPERLKSRARQLGQREVPHPVRFLIACVDVQKNRFVCQVHGIASNGDIYIVDRFDIRKSLRKDPDGERYWVNPAGFPEDWKLLTKELMNKTYPLIDGSGRRMGIKLTLCDSGGKDGVTSNAYDFVRWLRRGPDDDVKESEEDKTYEWQPGMAGRFLLVKGASVRTAPRAAISYPDSGRKDRHAGARGEVPVLMLNTDLLKDMVNNRLEREEPGGAVMFPDWLDDTFFVELTVEVRDSAKGWVNPKRYRNESWDLLTYCMAGLIAPAVAFEHIDWTNPPGWAAEWETNDLIFDPKVQDKPFDAKKKPAYNLAALAQSLG